MPRSSLKHSRHLAQRSPDIWRCALLPSEPLIDLQDLQKRYESKSGVVLALRGVNLQFERGEFVAIVGASGSGKSTLLQLMGCLDRPSSGRYILAGKDVTHASADERSAIRNALIGFVFQGFNLLPGMNALENCETPLLYRDTPPSVRRRRAAEALTRVGLGDRMLHHPNQLSGGQQQRVSIARALVSEPDLILADEPTGNLDTRTTYEILALLQAVNQERGVTIVLVTHEAEVAACAARVITVRDGEIVRDERRASPASAGEILRGLPVPPPAPAPTAPTPEQQPDRQRSLPRTLLDAGVGCLLGVSTLNGSPRALSAGAGVLVLSAWGLSRLKGSSDASSRSLSAFTLTLFWGCSVVLGVWLGRHEPNPWAHHLQSLGGWHLAATVALSGLALRVICGLCLRIFSRSSA